VNRGPRGGSLWTQNQVNSRRAVVILDFFSLAPPAGGFLVLDERARARERSAEVAIAARYLSG